MDAISVGLLALAHKLAGSVMLLFGVVMLPLPIPFGAISIILGLAFLAPYFAPVRAVIRTARHRAPALDAALVRHAHRCPPVVRKTIAVTQPA